MTNSTIHLSCVIDGCDRPFSVPIDRSEIVDGLRYLITVLYYKDFINDSPKDLRLWSVSIPMLPDNKNKRIYLHDHPSAIKLDLWADIATVFPVYPPKQNISIIIQRRSPVAPALSFNTLLKNIEREIFAEGTLISTFLRAVVEGDLSIPDAECCVTGLPGLWVRSSSCIAATPKPALYLLHPTRPHPTTRTAPSEAAFEKLKPPSYYDMITFFGASGCGKTRAVVEMLAQNWGFYFNSYHGDRGSDDMTTLRKEVEKKADKYLSPTHQVQNDLNIQAITVCLLISRLMILQYCLNLGCRDVFTCERWMLFQVCPGAFEEAVPDVFDDAFVAVLNAYNNSNTVIGDMELTMILHIRFQHIKSQIRSYYPDTRTDRFLVVLDEAQTLSDCGRTVFGSGGDHVTELRSVLSPIINGFRKISQMKRDYCVVTCGTGVSADELEKLAAGPREWKIIDFQGWETQDQIKMYLQSVGDTMPNSDRLILNRLIPKEAIREMFCQLRGRFRPIISTIEDIIAHGPNPRSYWKKAIARTVDDLVRYPTQYPMRGNLCSDIKRMMNKVANDPRKYDTALELKHVLKQTLIHSGSMALPWSLRGEEPILVEGAFGRLRISTDKAASIGTVIDEPFVFQAVYNYIQMEDPAFYKHYTEQYRNLLDPQCDGKVFERHVPLELIYIFHHKKLYRTIFSIPKPANHRSTTQLRTAVPEFAPVTFPPNLFGSIGTIVGWKGYKRGIQYRGNLTMADFLDAHYSHQSMKDGRQVPAFYYPKPFTSGPDIVFVLKVGDDLYPVFVQTKLVQKMGPVDVESARMTVHEVKLKDHLPNLRKYCHDNKYLSILYVHSVISKTERVWDAPSKSKRSCYRAGQQPLMQLLMTINGSNMKRLLPPQAVDFLDTVRGIKRGSDQSV